MIAPTAYVAEIPGGLVWGPEGTVVTPDGCVIADLTRAWGRPIEDHPIWSATPPEEITHRAGTVAVVAARGAADNFSHFLADTLPRIQLIRDAGVPVDAWILSGRDHAWQSDALRLAGIDAANIMSLADTPAVTSERLIVPSRTGFAPATAPWARRALRALIGPPPASRGQRILISRAHAARRRLVNEPELAARLAMRGYETLDFDRLPLAQQIHAIHQADSIVTLHGAALAHLLHAPADGTVIEIADPAAAHPEYWGLAALAGWAHDLIPAQASQPAKETIIADCEVDIGAVVAAVSMIES